MIGQKIHDKLITDFSALTFSEGGGTCFTAVKKFYALQTMQAQNCLIIPDSNNETIVGQSAGNFQTTRAYAYRISFKEDLESTNDLTGGDTYASSKYARLLNIADEILDYIQKEPSNLNAWGQAQSPVIEIYKTRLQGGARFDYTVEPNGLCVYCFISFSVFLNVIPQNL